MAQWAKRLVFMAGCKGGQGEATPSSESQEWDVPEGRTAGVGKLHGVENQFREPRGLGTIPILAR